MADDKSPPHPRTFTRSTRDSLTPAIRVIVYAPTPERAGWVDAELEGVLALVQIARSVEHVVAALVEDPPPRPQVLVIDLDAVSPIELLQLHEVREHGWCGKILACGRVPLALRQSLGITRVVSPRFDDGVLREEVTRHQAATEQSTAVIPVIRDM